ncbi:MAG: hypothetical protein ACM3JJ_05320 [Hyphomicrobiales bacterium]
MATSIRKRWRGWGRISIAALAIACVAAIPSVIATSPALAEGPDTPSESGDNPPTQLPPPPSADEDMPFTTGQDTTGLPDQETIPARTFISEIVDSTYFVGPAEFFALDLPAVTRGAQAVHLFGDVQVLGKGHDVIVRLFRSAEYQDWLKRRSGKEGKAIWVSPRSRAIHLDQDLPKGTPIVLLLDNGYSIRTPKRVRVQIQIQYQETGAQAAAASATTPAAPAEPGDIVPRSNTIDDTPPPPPPPPTNGSN